MPHNEGCQCPACRFRRGEGKGRVPRLSVCLSPDVLEWIRSRAEGARAYIERLVRRDRDAGQKGQDGGPQAKD